MAFYFLFTTKGLASVQSLISPINLMCEALDGAHNLSTLSFYPSIAVDASSGCANSLKYISSVRNVRRFLTLSYRLPLPARLHTRLVDCFLVVSLR